MEKYIFYILLFIMCPNIMKAQSSITDEQVMETAAKEYKRGTPRAQIVTKLMQSGADIQQIRRIASKLKKSGVDPKQMKKMQDGGFPERYFESRSVDKTEATWQNSSRMRVNNGELKPEMTPNDSSYALQYPEDGYYYPYLFSELEKELDKSSKVFGRDIFNNKSLSFEPSMNIPTPPDYQLGAGDEVIIDIFGASQRTIQSTISPDGFITVEGYGPVQLEGLTVSQANAKLRATIGARYRSSNIQLTVGQTKTIMVNVMGEVVAPGTYTLSAFATVFHALYMAGGTNDLGTLRNIQVYRNNKRVTVVDIYDYILNGKLTDNIKLSNNDVIIVGPYNCLVKVTGKVKRPMFYEMTKEESVGTLLKYAGGFTGDAYTKYVRLTRKTGKQKAVFNIGEFELNNFKIEDGDSIAVDSILNRFENTVAIEGSVFRPGQYNIGKDVNSVRTLIETAQGPKEDAFTTHAILLRMNPDRTYRTIQIDVEGIMSGKIPDIPLVENDRLFIPKKSELAKPRFVSIYGEVNNHGDFPFVDNETLEDLIIRAGGLKDVASTEKVTVSRRIINPKALQDDSIMGTTFSFALKDGFIIDNENHFTLKPFDQVYVHRSPGSNPQIYVRVDGQIMFPGSYSLTSTNERLSDLVKKAGGFKQEAYIKGARLERQISQDEQRRMESLLHLTNIDTLNDTTEMSNTNSGEKYYVGIELDKALKHPGGDDDLVLRTGDRLIIPTYNGTVRVSGEVVFPNTVAYIKGKKASYYINQAGGFGDRAKKSHTYIIYMNGTVSRIGNATITPGCEIIVPKKAKIDWGLLNGWMGIGTSAASLATMIATLANLLK